MQSQLLAQRMGGAAMLRNSPQTILPPQYLQALMQILMSGGTIGAQDGDRVTQGVGRMIARDRQRIGRAPQENPGADLGDDTRAALKILEARTAGSSGKGITPDQLLGIVPSLKNK